MFWIFHTISILRKRRIRIFCNPGLSQIFNLQQPLLILFIIVCYTVRSFSDAKSFLYKIKGTNL